MDKKQIELCMAQIMKQCKDIKIPISSNIDSNVIINYRARSRFACCKKQRTNITKYIIEVSVSLFQAGEQSVRNIIAHELLHTCYGCYNHGGRWKQYADKMNRTYGYKIKTTATYEELGLERPEVKREIKYEITCSRCGKKLFRQKKSKLVTNINQYRCQCGGTLTCKKR